MRAFERALICLPLLAQSLWAFPVDAAAAPVAAPQANRRAPTVKPVPQAPAFSTWPTVEELFGARVFEEPLVPIRGTPTPEENRALAGAIQEYLRGGSGENVLPLVVFLEGHGISVWRASLQLNLGLVYARTGYYSRAVRTLEDAWAVAKGAQDPRGRAIADRALGELLQISSRVGRHQRLGDLLEEAQARTIGGRAAEMVEQAKQAHWLIRHHPDRSLLCGPVGLDRILAFGHAEYVGDPQVREYRATAHGTTLTQMHTLANAVGLGFQMAKRADLAGEVPTPALIHWSSGHFAALLQQAGERYYVEDPAFGAGRWISRRALDDEASGYALLRQGPLPRGWRTVETAEADHVWGMGPTSQSDPERHTCEDSQSGGGVDCTRPLCDRRKGMAEYSFHTMLVSLRVFDTPVGYAPPKGPAVEFPVDYHQREVFQPQVFTYSNLGPKWTSGWISYIEDDPTVAGQPVYLYVRGGGQETHTGWNGTTRSYGYHITSRAQVVKVSDSPVLYERRLPGGAIDVYGQPNGALSYPRKVFLTRSIDAQGNAVELTYDQNLRLVAITDTIGQVTTLSYELTSDPLKITRVTDPFGRSATFEYDAGGRLIRITDTIGIQSSFGYGAGDFLESMTTPYGTTTFRMAEEGRRRWVEATDPLGGTERLEYLNSVNDAMAGAETQDFPYGLPSYPTGFNPQFPSGATNLTYRNTFYWSKRAMAQAPGKYTAAKLIHWLHTSSLTTTAGVIENEKEPLETMRTFYKYPGMTTQSVGTHATPSAVGRQMEDGTSQIWSYEYNARGKATKAIDPLGRETVYVYGTNNVPDANPTTGEGIDLLQVKQKNGANYDVLWSATYDSQHRRLSVTDTADQTTTYSYNSSGQMLTIVTSPRSGLTLAERTTTYTYDTNGYLQSVAGPAPGPARSYTYDGYGRIRTVTDSDGYTLTYDYDALDRVTKVTYPDGTFDDVVHNRLDIEKRRDRLGRWTQYFHDALRRLVAFRDAAGQTVQYQYGGSGCAACGQGGSELAAVIDANGNKTAWEHDLQGRVVREVAADGGASEYTYENTSSRVREFKDPKGQRRTYDYFLDDAVKQVTYADAVIATPTVSLTYDPSYRRLATVTDGTGTTTLTYHPSGELGAGAVAAVDGPLVGDSDKIAYFYDEIGRAVRREINGTANVTTQAFDSLHRLTGETNLLGAFSYSYEGMTPRVASIGYPNGQTTTLGYLDNTGDHRMAEIHHKLAGGATLSKFNYDTSVVGLISSVTQQADAAAATHQEFERDAVDRLTAAVLKTTDPTPSILKSYGYRYDSAGNRTVEAVDTAVVSSTYNNANESLQQQAGGALRFAGTLSEPAAVTIEGASAAVDAANRFEGTANVTPGTETVTVAATDPSGNVRTNTYEVGVSGSARSFTHDENGNLTSDGTRTFEWDAENRLVAVVQGTRRSEFTYNGLGQRVRIAEKDGGVVLSDRYYLWCGLSICEERDGSGSSVLRRFFHQGVQEGTDAYFYTRDQVGSIREMTDSSGALRARYTYDPYGRQTKLSGDKDAAFGFTGHLRHPQSGLELAPYRAYDPSLGRWISPDPIGLSGGDLNLYSYVGDSPVDRVDPTGEFAIAILLTPPGLAALTAAGKWTILVATAVIGGIALGEMTTVDDPPQPRPPVPPLPPPIPPGPAPVPAPAPAPVPAPAPTPVPLPPPPVPVPTTPTVEVPSGPKRCDDPPPDCGFWYRVCASKHGRFAPRCILLFILCLLDAQGFGGAGGGPSQ